MTDAFVDRLESHLYLLAWPLHVVAYELGGQGLPYSISYKSTGGGCFQEHANSLVATLLKDMPLFSAASTNCPYHPGRGGAF